MCPRPPECLPAGREGRANIKHDAALWYPAPSTVATARRRRRSEGNLDLEFEPGLTIGDLPARAARASPKGTAVITVEGRQTYGALSASVEAAAVGLCRLGLGAGRYAAILLPNGIEYLHAFFAVARTGGVVVPINTFLAAAEVAGVLEDCRAAFLLTTRRRLAALAPHLDRLRHLIGVVLADGEEGADAALPARIGVTLWQDLAREEAPAPPHGRRPGDLAILTYTSGTTGRMKGVMLTSANLLANARSCLQAVKLHDGDRLLVFLPMFHSLTQTVCMITPVLGALTIILLPGVDRSLIATAIRRHRPTIFVAVPAIYSAMADKHPGALVRWLNPVRLYLCGGAPLPMDVMRRFEQAWGRPLCEGYGLSEASPVVSLNPVDGERRPGSVGLPLPGVEVRILGEGGGEAAPGEIGEIVVRGSNVMAGYFERPEETAAALKDGWLHTGDLGRLDEQRYIHIVGRRKEMLIYRGMNVYPREVEEVLASHPEVAEAAVVGIEEGASGEVPHAVVALRPGASTGERDLRLFCRERLARYKVPRTILIVERLPRTATGKVLKIDLKQMVARANAGAKVSPGEEPPPPDA